MDCPCAKFGDFSFCRFGFIVRTDRRTDKITESQMRMTAIHTDATISASVIRPTVIILM